MGVWWEESVWPERSASGLEHEQVCVCVFEGGAGGGGSLSNSKMRWNLDDSVGLCPLIIQSFKLLSQPHKRPEEEGKTKASVLTFSLFVQYRFHQVLPQLCTDEVKS